MSLGPLSIAAALSLGAGPLLFARSFRDWRLRRLIQNTPTSRIRSMAMGLVEIDGTVAANSTLSAPFSGNPCAFWEVDIATPSGRNQWSIVHRNASGNPFYVEDDTGVALVFPHGAQTKVNFQREEECLGLTLPECYAQYMSQQGIGMRHVWRLSKLRFRERILEEGQRIYVLGTATPRAASRDVSTPEPAAEPREEGEAAARRSDLHQRTAAVVRRGENEPTFLISQESERTLTFQLGLRMMADLVGGPALTLFGLGYWMLALSGGGLHR